MATKSSTRATTVRRTVSESGGVRTTRTETVSQQNVPKRAPAPNPAEKPGRKPSR